MNETQTPRREVVGNPDGTVTEYSDFEPTEAQMLSQDPSRPS
jgi:hypothetical protein